MGRAIEEKYGADGAAWSRKHQKVLAELMNRWHLEFEEIVDAGLPINAICFVTQNERRLVLKTGYPEPELFTEIEVLKLWQGRPGCVQLIEVDEENGVILMERIVPGAPFRREPVPTRSSNIPPVFSDVPIDVPLDGATADLPTYEEWLSRAFTRYRASGENQLMKYIELAESLYRDLSSRYPKNWLLHGDLHHENMLRDERGQWIVIDPKGVLGPGVMEYGRFMHNFVPDEVSASKPAEQILMTRAGTLSGEFSELELLSVGFVDLVLSISWTVNDSGELTQQRSELLGEYLRLFS